MGTSKFRKEGETADAAKNALRRNHQRMQSMNAGQNGLSVSPSSDFNFTLGGGNQNQDETMSIMDPFNNQTPLSKQQQYLMRAG